MPKIKVHRINNQKIEPIKTEHLDPSQIKGYELFPELYSAIFLCAKKKSGKTNTIFHIMKNCINKNTFVYIFCSTVYKDSNYKFIRQWLEKNEIQHQVFTSIFVDDSPILTALKEKLSEEAQLKEQDEKEKKGKGKKRKSKFINIDSDSESEDEKEPKKKAPEYLFIFDDLSSQLKDPSFGSFIKEHRHYKSKAIISSQWWHDLHPEARLQLDYILIYPRIPMKKLEAIHEEASIDTEFKAFLNMYNDATNVKFNFLYIDRVNETFRHNFDYEYDIEDFIV